MFRQESKQLVCNTGEVTENMRYSPTPEDVLEVLVDDGGGDAAGSPFDGGWIGRDGWRPEQSLWTRFIHLKPNHTAPFAIISGAKLYRFNLINTSNPFNWKDEFLIIPLYVP